MTPTKSEDIRKLLPKPALLKLKDMGSPDVRILEVLGKRVLVKTVKPYTYMDKLEKEGVLVIPEMAKEANQPGPSTGIVLQLGRDLTPCGEGYLGDGENFYEDESGKTVQIVEEGSMVMFSRHAGSDISIAGEEDLRLLELGEILCTLSIPEAGVLPIKER